MKRKLIVIALIAIFALSLTFAACEHVHTYSDEIGGKDETGHWFKVTCGHDDAIVKVPHNMVPVPGEDEIEECDVCGYRRDTHQHTFSTEWEKDKQYHWHAATCKHTDLVSDKKEHSYVNGICSECGAWEKFSTAFVNMLSTLDVWNYTLALEDVDIGDAFGENKTSLLNGQLQLSLNAGGNIAGKGRVVITVSEKITVNGHEVVSKVERDALLVIDNGYAYVCASGNEEVEDLGTYVKMPLENVFSGADVDFDELKNAVKEIDDNFDRIAEQMKSLQEALQKLPVDLDKLLKDAVDVLLKEQTASNGETVYVINYDTWRNVNKYLSETTVEKMVDSVLGEGYFAKLPDMLAEYLDMTVGEVLDLLESKGVTVDMIVAELDKAIAENYPDPNVNTVDDLLKLMGLDLGMSFKLFIQTPAVSSMQFSALVDVALASYNQQNPDKSLTCKDLVDMFAQYCEEYGTKTVYEIAEASLSLQKGVIAKTAERCIDVLENSVHLSFSVKDNVLVKAEGYVQVDGKEEELPADADDADRFAYQIAERFKAALASVKGKILLENRNWDDSEFADVVKTVNEKLSVIKFPTDEVGKENLVTKITEGGDVEEITAVTVQDGKFIIDVKAYDETALFDSYRLAVEGSYRITVDLNCLTVTEICKGSYIISLDCYYQPQITKMTVTEEVDGNPPTLKEVPIEEFLKSAKDNAEFQDYDMESFTEFALSLLPNNTFAELVYNVEEGQFDVPKYHYFIEVTEQCVITDVCGEYSKIVKRCQDCGKSYVEYRYNEHDFGENEPTSVLNDSEDCTCGVKYYCKCNKCNESVLVSEYDNWSHTQGDDVRYELTEGANCCHDGVRTIYTCERCGKEYYGSYMYMEHIDSNVTTEEVPDLPDGLCEHHMITYEKCGVCNKIVSFVVDSQYVTPDNPIECSDCNVRFVAEDSQETGEHRRYVIKVYLNDEYTGLSYDIDA